MGSDMSTNSAEGLWVIRAGGAVLGESSNAVELIEDGHPPVIYFPRADIAMAFLEKSPTSSHSPGKGAATHYTIIAKSGPIVDAAWSYEAPPDGLERIAGHLAFAGDRVAVERL